MKLLLFILGLTLCAAYPAFRGQDSDIDSDFMFENPDDFASIDIPLDDEQGHVPRWLFTELFPSEEEALGEELLSNEEYLIEEDGVDADYVNLTSRQIRGLREVQEVLDYGVDQVIEKGNANGKIPVGNYEIGNVISVTRRRTARANYYRCNVEADGDNDVTVRTQFNVVVNKTTGEKRLNGWSFQAGNVKFTIDEAAYTQVNETEVESNPQIKAGLDYAIKEIVKDSEQYTDVDINSVYTQTARGNVYYKYDVTLSNTRDRTIDLVATVAYKPETGAYDVKSYSSRTNTRS